MTWREPMTGVGLCISVVLWCFVLAAAAIVMVVGFLLGAR